MASELREGWAVVGSSGFVGRSVLDELHRRGLTPLPLSAPRMPPHANRSPDVQSVLAQARASAETIEGIAERLRSTGIVINAAGLAQPDGQSLNTLIAANAAMPAVLALAADAAGVRRFIHVSSAAVLGPSASLHDRPETSPESAYALSKALGEEVLAELRRQLRVQIIIVRATSIHGPERAVTSSLQRVARSRLASVAAPGDHPSPVSSAPSLARLIADQGYGNCRPIVVQGWDGATTRTVLAIASGGREPAVLPRPLCSTVVRVARVISNWCGRRFEGHVRRLELMWFGQDWEVSRGTPTQQAQQDLRDALEPKTDEQLAPIGILSQWFDPETGPAALPGVYARALVSEGRSVEVLTGFPNYPDGTIYAGYQQSARHREVPSAGVSVTRVPLYASHDASGVRRGLNYLSFALSSSLLGWGALRRCTAVWVYNSPVTVSLPLLIHTRWGRRPYFLHVQDIWPDSLLASGMIPVKGLLPRLAVGAIRRVVALTERRAAVIGVISPSVKSLILERNPRLDPSKVVYVPNPTDESVFSDVRGMTGRELPTGDWTGTFTFMYIGALGALQRLDHVIDAFAGLNRDDVSLVLVGDGTARESLEAKVSSEGVTNVYFTGRIAKDLVVDYLAASDVQVVSLADEPFLRSTTPSKIPTTLASGRPILAHLSGDGAQLIEDAGAGLVAPSGDVLAVRRHMSQLVDADRSDLDEMATSGLTYYRNHLSAAAAARTILTELGLNSSTRETI